MANRPDIHRLIEFQQLMLAFQGINRVSYIPRAGKRQENDAEHSYFLAMAAWYLAPHFPQLDPYKMLRLALAHDLVEVHAGDTFVYGDQQNLDSKASREAAALAQLEQEWPDFSEMGKHIREYAEKTSEEAKFVYVLDKLLPPMINYLAGGKVWQENNVTLADFRTVKESRIPKDSPLRPYYEQILHFFEQKTGLFADDKP